MATISLLSRSFYFLCFFFYPFSTKSDHFISRFAVKNSPALYMFGDSLIDPGNNNHLRLPTLAKANFWPYGIDFEGGKATGRYTNGKTIADYIALYLGLPLVPPFLGLSELQRSEITTGINYASGACGILPDTGSDMGSCLSFDNQTELFERTIHIHLRNQFKEEEELKNHLAKSLFYISFGINDFVEKCSRNCPAESFGQFLLNEFSMRLQRLYNLGARKFLVNNIPPFGCDPDSVIHVKPNCDELKNNNVKFYNRKLTELLQQLQSQLPGSAFAHSDIFRFILELKADAHKYGIKDTSNPCCPQHYNGSNHCEPHSVPCKRRDTHLFFDEYHPSQIANSIYLNRCFNELSICTPSSLFAIF